MADRYRFDKDIGAFVGPGLKVGWPEGRLITDGLEAAYEAGRADICTVAEVMLRPKRNPWDRLGGNFGTLAWSSAALALIASHRPISPGQLWTLALSSFVGMVLVAGLAVAWQERQAKRGGR